MYLQYIFFQLKYKILLQSFHLSLVRKLEHNIKEIYESSRINRSSFSLNLTRNCIHIKGKNLA